MRIPIIVAATTAASIAFTGSSAKPKGDQKPNVMIILLDDVGFGHLSAFGGPYRTPNIERLSKAGLRYTNFHTTALCSPTRAALLTGRNHHSVGMATITETASDQPGYNGRIPRSAATLATMLQMNGYETYGLGKWHLTPQPESGIDGPFDRWPTSMGFNHWYGFQGADTDQWAPGLWNDTKPVEPPHDGKYHLTTDLADHAVNFVTQQANSDKPFFLYFAPGAGHAPHQVAKEWIDKNRGRFDEGWDVARENIFKKQKEMGIVPQDALLPFRNEAIKSWDSLSVKEKQLFTKMQEIHSGFIEHTDFEIGRILDSLQKSGKLENTLIIFTADNGASGEGGPFGSINEFRLMGAEESFDEVYAMLNDLGGPKAYNHYAAGWAQAGNTPFRYWKQMAHEGGVHDPMIVSWPAGIKDKGGIRPQFEHVTDVTPTILDAVGIKAPARVGDVDQMPLEGTAFNNTFASATTPSAKKIQYFEMIGNRGIWKDGWKAVAFHGRLPWLQGALQLQPFENDPWELFNVVDDPTESKDLAKQNPDKLRDMKALFDSEAKAHKVLPLDGSGLALRAAAMQMGITRGVTSMTFNQPKIRVSESVAPWLKDRSHTITADLEISGKANGVIVAHGGRFGGYSFYVKDGKLTYSHNYVGQKTYDLAATKELPQGKVTVRFEFARAPLAGKIGSGIAKLFVNEEKVAEGRLENTTIGPYGFADTFDIGSDTVTPVSESYQSPNAFNGKITKVKFDMKEDQGSDFEEMARKADYID